MFKGDMNSLEKDKISDIQKNYREFNYHCIQLLKVIEGFKNTKDNTQIIGAFEHEIVSFLTPFFHYIDSPLEDNFLKSLKKNHQIRKKTKNWKQKLVAVAEKLNGFIHGNRKKSIYLNLNVAKKTRRTLTFQWFFKYRLIFTDQFEKVSLSSNDIHTISELLKLAHDTFPKYIKSEFFENFISNLFLLKTKDGLRLPDYFVTGSNMNLKSRLKAFYFQKKGKKVISISHHKNGLITFEEPWTRYAELAFVDTYVDHGNKLVEIGTCKILQSDVPNGEPSNQQAVKYPNTLLYIPTSLSGFKNYGPYRAYKDEDYKTVQELLIENTTKLGIDLHIKQHPKQKTTFETGNVLSRFEFLEEVIDEYEYILLDYVSNASQLAITKNKTIFYLDFSIRKIHQSYLNDMETSIAGYYKINTDNDLRIALKKVDSIIKDKGEKKHDYSNLEIYFKNGKDKIEAINEAI